MTRPWLTLVGIGEDGTLAPGGQDALAQAEIIYGGARHLNLAGALDGEKRPWPSPFSSVYQDLADLEGRPVSILATGDPMWFGIGSSLLKHVSAENLCVLPSLSAFQLAASRMCWALQETECLSVHGQPVDLLRAALYPGARLLVLTSGSETPREVADLLADEGFGGTRMTVLEHLGGDRERRVEGVAETWSEEVGGFHTLALDVVAAQRCVDGASFDRAEMADRNIRCLGQIGPVSMARALRSWRTSAPKLSATDCPLRRCRLAWPSAKLFSCAYTKNVTSVFCVTRKKIKNSFSVDKWLKSWAATTGFERRGVEEEVELAVNDIGIARVAVELFALGHAEGAVATITRHVAFGVGNETLHRVFRPEVVGDAIMNCVVTGVAEDHVKLSNKCNSVRSAQRDALPIHGCAKRDVVFVCRERGVGVYDCAEHGCGNQDCSTGHLDLPFVWPLFDRPGESPRLCGGRERSRLGAPNGSGEVSRSDVRAALGYVDARCGGGSGGLRYACDRVVGPPHGVG